MLHRHDDDGLIVISQPAHAWISGQIARAWGNEALGISSPSTELEIAAEQHDIAWLEWESRPTLNPESGLPFAFNEMRTAEHLGLWATATPRSLSYGRLPAALISMHGTYLYRRFHDFDADSSEDARLAREFLHREEGVQSRLIDSLVADGRATREQIEVERRLVSLWDAMSLALCMGFADNRTFNEIPTDQGDISLQATANREFVDEYALEPWPFESESVVLQCEGRRLDGRFSDQNAMRDALSQASTAVLEFLLRPA